MDSYASVLDGYNGTIFAYGQVRLFWPYIYWSAQGTDSNPHPQTGSGKTFTITGGAERYADRGIIPRSLQYIFKEIQKVPLHFQPNLKFRYPCSVLCLNEPSWDENRSEQTSTTKS